LKQAEQAILQLPAGYDNDGQTVMEKVEAYVLEGEDHYEIKKTPLLVRGLAKGDIISTSQEKDDKFVVIKHSGNLAIRVFRKTGLELLENGLTPQVEMHDGSLDINTERALSYAIHVNLGFSAIETLFDNAIATYPDSVWYYGNVYDPTDGVTPLNWWDSFINQV
jgi:hypothetical protein